MSDEKKEVVPLVSDIALNGHAVETWERRPDEALGRGVVRWRSGLSATDVRDIYEADRAASREIIEKLANKLDQLMACPNLCIGGAYPTMPDGEPAPCQWCYEHAEELGLITEARAFLHKNVKP